MRIPRREIPAQPLLHLWERHKELARKIVAGQKPIEIAKDFNMSTSRISIIMNSPAFKKYVGSLRERVEIGLVDIRKEINKGAQSGVGLLLKLMSDDTKTVDDTQKFKSKLALEFLDRDGHGKVQKVQTQNTTVVLDAAKIQELKMRRQAHLDASRNETEQVKLIHIGG